MWLLCSRGCNFGLHSWWVSTRVSVVVNMDCQLERIQNHQGGRPLGITLRDYLYWVGLGKLIITVGGTYRDWDSRLNEKEKVNWVPVFITFDSPVWIKIWLGSLNFYFHDFPNMVDCTHELWGKIFVSCQVFFHGSKKITFRASLRLCVFLCSSNFMLYMHWIFCNIRIKYQDTFTEPEFDNRFL